MNIAPTAVTNAVNLAFFMVNFSVLLLRPFRQRQPALSVVDLEAHYRAQRYLHETIILLPVSPDPDLVADLEWKVLSLGAIHRSKALQPAA
jgi:putative transposase